MTEIATQTDVATQEQTQEKKKTLSAKFYHKNVCSVCNGKFTDYNQKKHEKTAKHMKKLNESILKYHDN